jgi:hypothetical protein
LAPRKNPPSALLPLYLVADLGFYEPPFVFSAAPIMRVFKESLVVMPVLRFRELDLGSDQNGA